MSSTHAVIYVLMRAGVRIERRGENIRYGAPKGVMNDSLRELMRSHKPAILAWLDAQEAHKREEWDGEI